MLPYAGRTHATILDAIEDQLPERDDAMPIDALKVEMAAVSAFRQIPSGRYFPGWHGITEIGY